MNTPKRTWFQPNINKYLLNMKVKIVNERRLFPQFDVCDHKFIFKI